MTATTERVRWPVVRTGPRRQLAYLVRLAVGRRDGFTCRVCHTSCPENYEADHIVPWSAGGDDDTTNLRVLCVEHNQERSNFMDDAHRRLPYAATWWCVECWSIDEINYRTPLRDAHGGSHDTSFAPFVEDGEFVAYCAHCQHLSWTDRVVVSVEPDPLTSINFGSAKRDRKSRPRDGDTNEEKS